MTEDYIDDWGENEFTDYTFHLLMCELERTNEKIRMWDEEQTEKENNNLKIESYDGGRKSARLG